MVLTCHVSLYQGDSSLVGLKNGVMLFFALSGYLIYRPFVIGDVNLKGFAWQRATRIGPAYLLALAGVSLLTRDTTFVEQPTTYLLFLQNYDPKLWQGFLGVSWTLVIEVLFYLSLPVLAFIIARKPQRLAAIAVWSFIGAVVVYLLIPAADNRLTSSLFPTMLWAFTPGMFVALFEGRIRWAARPIALAAGIALLALGTKAPWASVDLASGLGSFFVVAWAVERRPSLGIAALPASIGAALTYSAYLWHVDLLKTIPSTPLALLGVLVVSSLAYVIVERPFIRLGHRLAKRQRSTVSRSAMLVGAGGSPIASSEER
jgi:peptidoglycan/LPS O-acetylase OafA/YrhL